MKKLIVIILAIMTLFMATATYADGSKVFDKTISNGPSQQVSSANRVGGFTIITLNRYVRTGSYNTVSFRAYWAGEKVSDRFTFSQRAVKSCSYYSVAGFTTGNTVVLVGSIPEDSSTPGSATVNVKWNY